MSWTFGVRFLKVKAMLARIYESGKSAMQSGKANAGRWILEFEAEAARRVDPLMGWTSGSDTRANQVILAFPSREAAIAYAESRNIPYEAAEPARTALQPRAYSDNFAFRRRKPWTH
jgi:hypothetical protein